MWPTHRRTWGRDVTQTTPITGKPEDLLTVPEVAAHLGLTTKYVRDFLLRPGHIRSVRVSRSPAGPDPGKVRKPRYRVMRRDLDEYIARSSRGGTESPPRRRQRSA